MRPILLTFLIVLTLQTHLFSQENTYTISGIVTEDPSGEYVISGTVRLSKKDPSGEWKVITGAYTNQYGFYSIADQEPGNYLLTVSGIGFKTFKSELIIKDSDLRINVAIEKTSVLTQEVVVEATRDANPKATMSTIAIQPDFISRMPTLGETDIFRALQLLPGIQQGNELSSGLYIRGGSPDQNLVLLDDVIVYNPSHLGGFLSTFNTDAIRNVKVIKGAFPAEYGGRLSSVIDLQMKEGTKEDFSGAGGVSLISSRLTLEGPIGEDLTYMISGRRMYLDLLQSIATSGDSPQYYFYDLNSKLSYKISDNDRIFLSGFFGRDVLNADDGLSDIGISWGNKTGNFRWMHIVSPKLFTNFSLIYTDYNFQTDYYEEALDQQLRIFSGINDITAKGKLEYQANSNNLIKAGFEVTAHQFNSFASLELLDNDSPFEEPDNKINAIDGALFVQDEWQVSDRLSTNIGARLYYFQNGDYLNVESRLAASYALGKDLNLNLGYMVANQYLHLVVRNDITLPTDLWFPSTETIKPSRSQQFSIGLEKTLNNGQYLITTEAYYKDMNNIYEYKDGADFNFGVPLEEMLVNGRGEAYGMEVFLNKRLGDLTGWIGYTLSWSKRHFDELNNGKWFYPRFDRRHDLSIVLNYKISKSWEASWNWVYGTGQAFTMPTGSYQFDGDQQDYFFSDEKYQFTDRNAFRLPSYHRMDLNFIYHYEWFGIPFEFNTSFYNLYNRRNPFAWYINRNYETGNKEVRQITLFPFIPNIGLSFKF